MQEYPKYSGSVRYKGAVARNGHQRGSHNLYITIAAAIIAALGALLCVNVFFNISAENLSISGSTLYADEQIKAVGGIVEGQNLIRLNTDYIAERLKNNLVYIDDVKILKKYPDGLVISITEATEKAQIEYNGSYYTVSSSNRLLEVKQSERDQTLPLVEGYELKSPKVGEKAESEDDEKADILKNIFEELEATGFSGIGEINLTDRTDITLNYDNRITLEIGSSVDLELKFKSLKSVIDTGLPESYEGTLRYNSAESGISAIPKEEDVPYAVSSSADSSSESSSDGEYTDSYTDNYGYTDSYGYDDGYTDGYTTDSYGYDDGYTDGYATDSYSYDDGYTTDSYGYYDNYTDGYTTDSYYSDGYSYDYGY